MKFVLLLTFAVATFAVAAFATGQEVEEGKTQEVGTISFHEGRAADRIASLANLLSDARLAYVVICSASNQPTRSTMYVS